MGGRCYSSALLLQLDSGSMSGLDVLLGGGLALFAQWFVTPQVERRVRAQERWEQDLLQLRSFVSQTLDPLRERARSEWRHLIGLHEINQSADFSGTPAADKLAEQIKIQQVKVDDALRSWRDSLSGHPEWLAHRIVGQLRSNAELKLEIEWMHYTISVPFYPGFGREGDVTQLADKWAPEDVRYKALVGELDRLVDATFARPRSVWNLRWHARSWVHRQTKRLRRVRERKDISAGEERQDPKP